MATPQVTRVTITFSIPCQVATWSRFEGVLPLPPSSQPPPPPLSLSLPLFYVSPTPAHAPCARTHIFWNRSELVEYIKKQYRLCKKQNLIREIPVIQAISSKEGKADFIHCLELQIKMPGDRICTQGMRGKEMYFLIRGSCQVYDENIQGGLYLTSLKAGSFFGEVALLNGCRLLNSASIRRGSIGSSNQMAGKGSEEVDVRRTASVYTQSFCELQVSP